MMGHLLWKFAHTSRNVNNTFVARGLSITRRGAQCIEAPHFAIRMVNRPMKAVLQVIVILLIVALIGFCTAVLAATSSPVAMSVAVKTALIGIRTWRFPPLVYAKYPTCSVADAWLHATHESENLAKEDIEKRIAPIRVDGDLSLFDTPDGQYWAPSRDLPTLAEMIVEQQHAIYGSINKGDVVVDCGSNIGVFTRRALRSGARLVIAVDVSPQAITCFRRNFEREIAGGRVILSTEGVWDRDETLSLTTSESSASTANSVALQRGRDAALVRLTTLDAIISRVRPDRVNLIKMDIEGAEPQALRGSLQTVRKYRPRLAIALEHRPTDVHEIPSLIHHLWPDRIITFGSCGNVFDNIQPQVVFAL